MAIARELRRRGPLDRSVLAAELAAPETTFRHAVDLLLKSGVAVSEGRSKLRLNPEHGILVGVDVTRRTATVAVSDLSFRLLNDPDDRGSRASLSMDDPAATIRTIAELVAGQLARAGVDFDDAARRLVGVGMTLPGPISRKPGPDRALHRAAAWDRAVRAGPILPGWDDCDVAAQLAVTLKQAHGLRPPGHERNRRFVWLENDASAGALGVHTELRETIGEQAPDDFIYVRIAGGIGAGIISKGHLLTGAHGYAGELGHISVDPNGALCPGCGGRGCLETVASATTVSAQLAPFALSADPGPSDPVAGKDASRSIGPRLQASHPAVNRTLHDAGWHVGIALAGITCFLNPSWIVFGGAIPEHRAVKGFGSLLARRSSDEPRPFIGGVRQALEKSCTPQALDDLEIKTWNELLGDQRRKIRPELLGALGLALDHLGDAFLLPPIARA
jgi:predicted NBD/HSP70 family sugar kinase